MGTRGMRLVESVLRVAIALVTAQLAWLVMSPVLFRYTSLINVLPGVAKPVLATAPSVEARLAVPAYVHGYEPLGGSFWAPS
ncbi:MAG: hypothetical protein M3Q27_04410 [Actinomycetota bacterium]|nr:hypothetical protein [Actinomycetota bacterium]